ncbi:MAG TPA: pinensin family lanthipeptide [Longimicrobium sp.]|nr:pinensin family lanthipeptide [Longimicrobium sp.]
MKKLKLQIEQLAVESFATAAAAQARGTVQAHGTVVGYTCGAGATCGPETCGELYCIPHTDNPNICGGGGGTAGCSSVCPGTGQLSCVGCTTYDYTVNPGDDSCGRCMSFESDSPQRCRCI